MKNNISIYDLYKQSCKLLHDVNKDEINIRILISFINKYESMSDFYLNKDENIKDLRLFNEFLQRFLNGEPIQYILKEAYFYNNNFYVDSRVLIPRLETEEVVDYAIKKAKEIFNDKLVNIYDVCCGSGCIGISVSKHISYNSLTFSDISVDALDVCNTNCHNHNIKKHYSYLSNGLKEIRISKKDNLIICNPPYILNKDDVSLSTLQYEPHLALFCDTNLSIYKEIISECVNLKLKNTLLVFEIGYDLKDSLETYLSSVDGIYEYSFLKDINKKDRILSIYLK